MHILRLILVSIQYVCPEVCLLQNQHSSSWLKKIPRWYLKMVRSIIEWSLLGCRVAVSSGKFCLIERVALIFFSSYIYDIKTIRMNCDHLETYRDVFWCRLSEFIIKAICSRLRHSDCSGKNRHHHPNCCCCVDSIQIIQCPSGNLPCDPLGDRDPKVEKH